MPLIGIKTNLKTSQIPENFVVDVAKVAGDVVGKPVSKVLCFLTTDQQMSFGGTTEPCALVTLRSIGNIHDRSDKIVSELTKFLVKCLELSQDRFYILFQDLSLDDIAYKGLVMRELRKQQV
ncbi:unnamed protein product [Bursaphelenchus okinawaensis]|uniref:L-dopachrome isomerase n=1 Tax=Bursaphelenchus okinawaensis TaxID=465554 RepID=A0A811KN95_9BILA|nr:unnamed protein product [Bursaphelenchus okinawaensis]CAG9108215.1 unnamed protein product [Bursaphelenchus okinawaensis]